MPPSPEAFPCQPPSTHQRFTGFLGPQTTKPGGLLVSSVPRLLVRVTGCSQAPAVCSSVPQGWLVASSCPLWTSSGTFSHVPLPSLQQEGTHTHTHV